MRVTVELISPFSVLAGRAEPFAVKLAETTTGMELVRALGEQVKELPLIHRAVAAGGMMLLVNQEQMSPQAPLMEGDGVSVVLRVSGI